MLAFVPGLAGVARSADLGPHLQPPGNLDPCKVCHDTASSDPRIRGWAVTGIGASGWSAKPISYMCYMCHQGTPLYGAHNMSANAYADTSHGYVVAQVPREPEGSLQGSRYRSVGQSLLPYTATGELECTSCHNVHSSANRPFSHRATIPELCEGCHQGRANDAAATALPGESRDYSTHPTQRAIAGTPRANLKVDAEVDPKFLVPFNAAPNWALGGHLSAGASGTIVCSTCHAVHGPVLGTPGLKDLLAIDNETSVGTAEPSRLCEGCHFGGAAGEQVGSVVLQADLAAGEYSDHPIDAVVNRSFYPTGAVLPAAWENGTTPNVDRGSQPFYLGLTPVCSSCHDIHGGIADSPLARGPQPTDGWGAMNYGDWCFACHTAAQVLPVAHHSVINTLSTALGDPFDSLLTCGDCHGPAGTRNWTAHNGFWKWAVVPARNDSAFCLACHTASDPTSFAAAGLKGQSFAAPVGFPSTHGTTRGAASHYLGPDSNEFPGVDPKITAWSSGYFSSYGAPNTGGGGDVAPTAAGEIICGSCHQILFNDGRANPGSYTTPVTALSRLRAGWQSNLLLEPYADDSPGTGDGTGAAGVGAALCTGCHAKSGNHHPQTGDIVPLSGLALRTGAGSYADKAGAPGTLSYPNPNQLDCDSCHRPHRADDDSDVAGAVHGSGTSTDGRPTRHILEIDGANHRYSPDLCAECHNK